MLPTGAAAGASGRILRSLPDPQPPPNIASEVMRRIEAGEGKTRRAPGVGLRWLEPRVAAALAAGVTTAADDSWGDIFSRVLVAKIEHRLGLDRAATVLIILVLGGYGRLYGAFIGAAAYLALSHFLAKLYPTAWQLGLGLLLVVIALFARNGILGIAEVAVRAAGRRGAGAPPSEASL